MASIFQDKIVIIYCKKSELSNVYRWRNSWRLSQKLGHMSYTGNQIQAVDRDHTCQPLKIKKRENMDEK